MTMRQLANDHMAIRWLYPCHSEMNANEAPIEITCQDLVALLPPNGTYK